MDYIPNGELNRLMRRIPREDLLRLEREIRREAARRKVFFHFREGQKRYIPIALKPWVLTRAQHAFLRGASHALERAARRVLAMRQSDPGVRAILPMTEEEERWIGDAYRGDYGRPETLFSRMDVSTHLGRPDWRERLRFIEANLVGIGAAYYCYSAGRIAYEAIAPVLRKHAPSLRFRPQDDLLEMIHRRCRAHGKKIGRPDPAIAFIEFRRVLLGPFEFETMCGIYRERGYRTVVADPTELDVRRGELYARGTRVDLLYRDPTLLDLVEMEEEDRVDLAAIRWAFRENRVVSSLCGEVDHKGLFELFSGSWLRRFPPRERALLRRTVPWTRVLRETKTEDPSGRRVDLPDHARRRREDLVMKPNRGYGGSGIKIGRAHV